MWIFFLNPDISLLFAQAGATAHFTAPSTVKPAAGKCDSFKVTLH